MDYSYKIIAEPLLFAQIIKNNKVYAEIWVAGKYKYSIVVMGARYKIIVDTKKQAYSQIRAIMRNENN